MGPEGAVNIVFRKELEEADDPEARRRRADRGVPRAVRQPVHRGRARLRRRRDRAPPHAPRLIDALETALTKREPRPPRKHGNIPL